MVKIIPGIFELHQFRSKSAKRWQKQRARAMPRVHASLEKGATSGAAGKLQSDMFWAIGLCWTARMNVMNVDWFALSTCSM